MEPTTSREKLVKFLESLAESVQSALLDKKIVVDLFVNDLAAAKEFALYEVENICEGVRRVLAGEDSPANLVSFIEKDRNIEDDNRGKILMVAQEIQKQIFDVVLPILKQAGMPVKEGRVPSQPTTDNRQPTTPSPSSYSSFPKGGAEGGGFKIPRPADGTLPLGKGELRPPSSGSSLQATSYKLQAIPMDERHLRALLRIAAGTNYAEEKLREAFEDLPEGLRRAIVSVDTANAVQEIAKKFLLHVDQMGALASETGLVLLGLTHPKDFVKNLAARLRISEARALEIAREVSGQILVKVREALRGLHEGKPSYENTNYANIRMATNKQEAEPVRKLGVFPRQEEKKGEPFGETKVQPFRSRTPYSAEAKWKTEDEQLTREEVLQGIEQPTETQLKTSNLRLETLIGPTGWRPPAADGGKSQFPISNFQPKQPPALPKAEPQNFLEQKLAGPMGLPKEERRYTIDPYREPVDS